MKSKEIRTKPFAGVECEGPYKGAKTLFVPGGVRADEFDAAWRAVRPERVYLGAGNVPLEVPRDLDLIVAAYELVGRADKITAEVVGAFPQLPDCVVVSHDPTDLPKASFVKRVDGETVSWESLTGTVYSTRLDDPAYDQDYYV